MCIRDRNNGNGTGSMDECQYRCVDEFGGDGPVAFDCVTGEVP